jgi:hypothetical protein
MLEDNIKMDIESGFEDVDWIHLSQDRVQWKLLVCTIMILRVRLSRDFLDRMGDC